MQHLQAFAERYSRNAFVITCRLAARKYEFEAFTEVEVAAFNQEQMAHFVEQWFCQQQQAGQAALFLQALREQPPLRDLATRPLFLTLLCLVFESTGAFPTQRWKLYRDSFKALLKARAQLADAGWEPFYEALSPSGREAFFRQFALLTFTKGISLFDLDTAARLIKQVLPHCLHSTNDALNLEALDIEAFLATIERQHGVLIESAHEIYAFAHRTLHEYFTARQLVETADQQSLTMLAHQLTNPHWREVLCMTLEMLPTCRCVARPDEAAHRWTSGRRCKTATVSHLGRR
jgi:predicted NACHT family NTPase